MVPESTDGAGDNAVPEAVAARLHRRFCAFQAQAKLIEESTRASQAPLAPGVAEAQLERYSSGLVADLRLSRDELRRGKWDISEAVKAEYDSLCFCLAVWELVHEVMLSTAPTAPRILHWYNRHYLEEDISEWWQAAQLEADGASATDAEFWKHLCHLAVADCRGEVLDLLQRSLERTDDHVAGVCHFLRRMPSLRQMDEAGASEVEQRQALGEIQNAARELLRTLPAEHLARDLISIYAGASQSTFEDSEDAAYRWSRSWVEDFAYAHAWVFPDLRRGELSHLLRAVARRRSGESIDDIDRVLFAALTLDVPALLRLVQSLPGRFPSFFVTHLVDVLYFAGRIPLSLETGGSDQVAPPRDFHLMAYARHLGLGSREERRFAVDYLRAGHSEAAQKALESAVDLYSESAESQEEIGEVLDLLTDLGLGETSGLELCRRRSKAARSRGDVPGCLRWACCSEGGTSTAGAYASELLDDLATEDLTGLLELLTPPDASAEPLDEYPPAYLTALLAPPGERALAPSGRLYFYVQYARCRALRRSGAAASAYAPQLVRLLTSGVVPPALASMLIEEDLFPVLHGDTCALTSSETLLLMRYVQSAARDPLHRVQLKLDPAQLHFAMGTCLSRAVLEGPARASGGFAAAMAITAGRA
eukprot:TRINITY_DN62720_c0_g1_i1.p1 TRINITY_DN62720_c0_g1~~TRINITY_DN62720_c0_g1_i1.p1  ORF type:complete len:671 (+),score=156.64 TRINITY_DN62720_c0_g1_i1:65-2014(+)